MLASWSSPRSSPAKTMGSLRPLPCPPKPVQPGWPARTMPPRSMPTWTKLTSSGSFCSGLRSVQSSRAAMPDDAAVFQPVLRHVLHRLLEAEEAGADPGPLREADVLLDLRHALGRGGGGQQVALEVAGQVDLLLAVAEGRAEGVRRLRLAPRRSGPRPCGSGCCPPRRARSCSATGRAAPGPWAC